MSEEGDTPLLPEALTSSPIEELMVVALTQVDHLPLIAPGVASRQCTALQLWRRN